jgi:hypothetical protein
MRDDRDRPFDGIDCGLRMGTNRQKVRMIALFDRPDHLTLSELNVYMASAPPRPASKSYPLLLTVRHVTEPFWRGRYGVDSNF